MGKKKIEILGYRDGKEIRNLTRRKKVGGNRLRGKRRKKRVIYQEKKE